MTARARVEVYIPAQARGEVNKFINYNLTSANQVLGSASVLGGHSMDTHIRRRGSTRALLLRPQAASNYVELPFLLGLFRGATAQAAYECLVA